jgi:hypothetical protein
MHYISFKLLYTQELKFLHVCLCALILKQHYELASLFYLYFTDMETEAWRNSVTYSVT